ncbi:MAG: co-chaperone DjlA [Gammaproteobacteria bacterium]|nr:MAG: co-chaperone DjlA [Gammaproteobacteria bacterium]
MSWLGKILGGTFGFFMGGPLGAVLGAALGHQFDKGVEGIDRLGGDGFNLGDQARVQTAFFTATFSVMGHIAKADGHVSPKEIEMAKAVMSKMELSPELRKTAINLFNEGKKEGFPLDAALEQFRKECHRRSTLIQMFIEIQLQAAFADGDFDDSEEALLLHICDQLGFSRYSFQRIKALVEAQQRFSSSWQNNHPQSQGPTLSDAYQSLGQKESASDAEVKKAYRRLMSQHHPDKLVSKGLPEEMMKIATEKTKEIQKAYETIREARKSAQ